MESQRAQCGPNASDPEASIPEAEAFLERLSPCFALCPWGRPSFSGGRPDAFRRVVLYHRRRLPHWIPDHAVIFVTSRLADSRPPVRPAILTSENTGRMTRSRMTRTGSRWFRQPRVARIVENALRHGERAPQLLLPLQCVIMPNLVMPNHVPTAFQPEAALPSTMRWLKGRTGRVVNRAPVARAYLSDRMSHTIIGFAQARNCRKSLHTLKTTQ